MARQRTVRLAIIDRDIAFTQPLAARAQAMGWLVRVIPMPIVSDALVALRLSCLVVDVGALGASGWNYLEHVWARLPRLPVIVCTRSSTRSDRVRGLRSGADVWLAKPCHPEELIANIEAALRMHRQVQAEDTTRNLALGEITLRLGVAQAYAGDDSLRLTPQEFQVLRVLVAAHSSVIYRDEIYERAWGYPKAHGDKSVDEFVRRVRSKLLAASPSWTYIHTHFGVGYRFEPMRHAGTD